MARFFKFLSFFLLALSAAWFFLVHPPSPAVLAASGEAVFLARGRTIHVFGMEGGEGGSWTAPREVRQMVAGESGLGLVGRGSDSLLLCSPAGGVLEEIQPPLKAGGRGRWARVGHQWAFLNPSQSSVFIREKDGWKPFIEMEEELSRVLDISGWEGGLGVLVQDPPGVKFFETRGAFQSEKSLARAGVWPIQRPVVERFWDYLRPQRPEVPVELRVRDGERLLVLFQTENGKYRRLVYFGKERKNPVVREVFLGLRTAGRKSRPQPQSFSFQPEGPFLLTSTKGGLWLYGPNSIVKKQWLDLDPSGAKGSFFRQPHWAWFFLLAALAAWGLSLYVGGGYWSVSRRALLMGLASLVLPGLGQWILGKKAWGVLYLSGTLLWCAVLHFLVRQLQKGSFVSTAVLVETGLAILGIWLAAVLHAFWLGLDPRKE